MSVSSLNFLRASPPPPQVVLLPAPVFFSRAVPVAAGASAAEAATQIELALEGLSPFPLAQLYYGWFWTAGTENALVFAAYRRRFTADQTSDWTDAELVAPSFAALLGAEGIEPSTTIILHAPEAVTAVHWETPAVPSKVLSRVLEPDAPEADRTKARDELVAAMGGSRKVVELTAPPTADPATNDREVVLRAGDFVSRLPVGRGAAWDVRDKGDLAALRNARRRDVVLWRTALGCVAALLVLGLGELALVGGRIWQDGRLAKVRAQKPTVEKIMSSQSLANRIDELSTKRLLPFEMINVLFEDNRKPAEITFIKVITLPQTGIYTLTIEASSSDAAKVPVYEATLRNLPMLQRVEIRDYKTRGETASFSLVVTFKPDSLKPAESLAP
jgi:hypothetical protein